MLIPHAAVRRTVLPVLFVLVAFGRPVAAQELSEDMVGQTEQSWRLWKSATTALEREEGPEADKLFDQVAGLNLSELRLALMAERTGSLRLEQRAASADGTATEKAIVEKIKKGREQKQLAEDGWHLAAIGRFKIADADFKALDQSAPDPVALLELSRMNPNRQLILVKLVANTDVGPSAKRMIALLNEGEQKLRTDPYEIAINVAKLGGTPRTVYNATAFLKDSGEYAIPHLIEALQDPKRAELRPAIIQVLPQIGRGGLNPMCIALSMNDQVTKQILINALGQIGYRQPVPYLARLNTAENATADVKAAASQALRTLGESSGRDVSGLFYELADNYYKGEESLQADPRKDQANVWYLVDGKLQYIPVPTAIFNDVMAMRCSEDALNANTSNAEATSLWIAANFRREAKLGLDVENDAPDALAAKDGTRPEHYSRSIYFARAAGPMYNHRVLARAVADRDPGVALGAIAALSATAGAPSLVGAEDIKQPLVQALAFPNRQVRIKTALALARALPENPFDQSSNVAPVLAEALSQSSRQSALVVDPDDNTRSKFQALLRAAGFDCGVGPSLYQAQTDGDKAGLTTYDLILLASDVSGPELVPAINELRRNFKTAATPILVVAKAQQTVRAQNATHGASGVEMLLVDVLDLGDAEQIKKHVMDKVAIASRALGMTPLSSDLSLNLAMQTADVIRAVLESNRNVFDIGRTFPALIKALEHPSEPLRVKVAHALALASDAPAQTAIAEAALKSDFSHDMRVAAFGSLAESARRNGNLLAPEVVEKIIHLTMTEQDLTLQGAASKALGALDLPSNKASEIIRSQSRG